MQRMYVEPIGVDLVYDVYVIEYYISRMDF